MKATGGRGFGRIGPPTTGGAQAKTGVHHVWVNGAQVLRNGEHTGALPGRVVKATGRVKSS